MELGLRLARCPFHELNEKEIPDQVLRDQPKDYSPGGALIGPLRGPGRAKRGSIADPGEFDPIYQKALRKRLIASSLNSFASA